MITIVDESSADVDIASVETAIKYAGYLKREESEIERARRDERRRIPPNFPFDRVPGLSREFVLSPDTLEIGARLKRAKQGLADRTREKSAHEFKDAGKLQRVTGKAVVREAWISHADVLFDREKDPNTES